MNEVTTRQYISPRPDLAFVAFAGPDAYVNREKICIREKHDYDKQHVLALDVDTRAVVAKGLIDLCHDQMVRRETGSWEVEDSAGVVFAYISKKEDEYRGIICDRKRKIGFSFSFAR